MEYREALDRLLECGVSMADVAAAAGVQHQTIRATRLDASSPSHRRPPEDWRAILARVARGRVDELTACANDLSALADELEPTTDARQSSNE